MSMTVYGRMAVSSVIKQQSNSHIDMFLDGAQYLRSAQDAKGGWPIATKRVLSKVLILQVTLSMGMVPSRAQNVPKQNVFFSIIQANQNTYLVAFDLNCMFSVRLVLGNGAGSWHECAVSCVSGIKAVSVSACCHQSHTAVWCYGHWQWLVLLHLSTIYFAFMVQMNCRYPQWLSWQVCLVRRVPDATRFIRAKWVHLFADWFVRPEGNAAIGWRRWGDTGRWSS